jgi:ParB-like chromosome segregation protein Spo0J
MIEQVNINEVTINPNNPRLIKDDKFEKLVKSIQDFPEMLKLRPIVVDDNMVVLGGNMRLQACKKAKLKKVWVIKASELTEEQKKEFIIKDNVGFGEWDWDVLANEWESEQLEAWGLDVPGFDVAEETEAGDIVELDKITTTFNINIKCDSPEELEEMKFKLGITSNSIHSTMLIGLLA